MKTEKAKQAFLDYPNNIGKIRKVKDIHGKDDIFVIADEIRLPQHNNPNKLIVFQKLEHQTNKKLTEYRFGYYMIGVKEGMKGKWVWGQFCLMIPSIDLKKLLKQANDKGWNI